jgi:hypothetical protein
MAKWTDGEILNSLTLAKSSSNDEICTQSKRCPHPLILRSRSQSAWIAFAVVSMSAWTRANDWLSGHHWSKTLSFQFAMVLTPNIHRVTSIFNQLPKAGSTDF